MSRGGIFMSQTGMRGGSVSDYRAAHGYRTCGPRRRPPRDADSQMPEDNALTDGRAPEPADDRSRIYFDLFIEIGMVAQLTRSLMVHRLPDGLIELHFRLLDFLVRAGDGRTPFAIAQAFQVPKTSVTHTLSTLAARGLIEIRPNPADGRSKLVYLTPAGRDLRARAVDALGPEIAALAADHPPEEIAELVPRLRRIRRWLGSNRRPL